MATKYCMSGFEGSIGESSRDLLSWEYFDEWIDSHNDESPICLLKVLPVFHISVVICWSKTVWGQGEEGLL